jgi:hypothetical protein
MCAFVRSLIAIAGEDKQKNKINVWSLIFSEPLSAASI